MGDKGKAKKQKKQGPKPKKAQRLSKIRGQADPPKSKKRGK
jgi:hypothetical protein